MFVVIVNVTYNITNDSSKNCIHSQEDIGKVFGLKNNSIFNSSRSIF